jgi:hypothetical protein
MGYSLTRRSIDTKNELLRIVADANVPTIILGRETEAPGGFCLIEVASGGSVIGIVAIIWAGGAGIGPEVLTLQKMLYVGHNHTVSLVQLQTFGIVGQIDLLSRFDQFVTSPSWEQICVVCETAIVVINLDGNVIWRRDTDVIQDFRITGRNLILELFDNPHVKVDIVTGESR